MRTLIQSAEWVCAPWLQYLHAECEKHKKDAHFPNRRNLDEGLQKKRKGCQTNSGVVGFKKESVKMRPPGLLPSRRLAQKAREECRQRRSPQTPAAYEGVSCQWL